MCVRNIYIYIYIYRRWKLTYSIKLSFVMMPIQTSQVNSQYISEYTERNYYPSNIVFGHLKWNLQMGKIYHDQFGLYHYFIRLFVNYFVADHIKKRDILRIVIKKLQEIFQVTTKT